MNIILITEFFPKDEVSFTGGVEARTFFIHKYLSQNHHLEVISRAKTQVSANFLSIFPRLWFIVSSTIKALSVKAEVIEGSNFICYLPTFVSAKIKGAKAVAWYADAYQKTWFENYSLPTALTGFLLEWISLKLPWDTVIAMSRSTEQKLIKAGVNPHKITVVYGGVEHQKLKDLTVKKYKKPTICTLARLVNYKRINDLIQAFFIVKTKVPDARLLILGTGPELQDLQSLTKKLKLENSIKFLDNVPHEKAMKILKRCHVFCLPSVVEGFGLVTIEACACGVPYVNSDIPPTKEITQGGQGGYLFEPKNPRELAEKITILLKFKKRYHQKQKEALSLAKNYDWSIIAKQTQDVYGKS